MKNLKTLDYGTNQSKIGVQFQVFYYFNLLINKLSKKLPQNSKLNTFLLKKKIVYKYIYIFLKRMVTGLCDKK